MQNKSNKENLKLKNSKKGDNQLLDKNVNIIIKVKGKKRFTLLSPNI
jgi:hypothetical protein